MKKEMILTATPSTTVKMKSIANTFKSLLLRPIAILTEYYSAVLDRRISNSQTLWLLNAQFAFFSVVCSAEAPLMTKIICWAWLAQALIRCKTNVFNKTDE